ncbi:MAG: hypothetical protein AAFV93_12015 [Chloroflexota bacterium]
MAIITHVARNKHIHEVVFTESSRGAIDQFLSMLSKIYEQSNGLPIYIVLDMRHSGMLPLRYLTKSLRRTLEQFPNRPPANIAIVLEDPQMLNVTRALLRTITHRESVQYFTQIDKARLWLQLEYNRSARR